MKLPKLNVLGHSAYLNENECETPDATAPGVSLIFISLHMPEEFSHDFAERAEHWIHELHDKGYRILADVSQETLAQFHETDLLALAERLHLWGVRLDYGFPLEEVLRICAAMPTAVNASTITMPEAQAMAKAGKCVMAMHNFYPRPETGLDEDTFRERNEMLHQAGMQVIAFIPGDACLRGPLKEGLPTLEKHRGWTPFAAYADLCLNDCVDYVFAGDPGVSSFQERRIARYIHDDVMEIPCTLQKEYESLYGRVYTNRIDSPRRLIRFQESRGFGMPAQEMAEQGRTMPRLRGSITMDNMLYGRYCGEIQLIREDLPADEKVNVIGQTMAEAMPLIDLIKGNQRFVLVRE
jgi:hypothetical protein